MYIFLPTSSLSHRTQTRSRNQLPKYQLDSLDSVQRRPVLIVDDTYGLESFSLWRGVALRVFNRLYYRDCSEELFELVLSSRFYRRTFCLRSLAHHHIVASCISFVPSSNL